MPFDPADPPAPFSAYTTPEFWDDPHVSAHLLACHLDPESVPASRPHAFIARSVDWLVTELRLGPGARVLDLGCGPGLYAAALARRGVAVHGVDVSRRSLAYARDVAERESLPLTFTHGSYLDVDLGAGYDAALLIYEDLCALSPAQRAVVLARAHDALRPGGSLVTDVTAPARFTQEHPTSRHEPDLDAGFWAEPPYDGTHERWTYPSLRLVLDRYTIVKDAQVRQFWNWMHCLTPDEVRAELTAAGFTGCDVRGDVAGAPYDPSAPTFAVVARA